MRWGMLFLSLSFLLGKSRDKSHDPKPNFP